jgi:deoxyribodipyrimidine photo-lyase
LIIRAGRPIDVVRDVIQQLQNGARSGEDPTEPPLEIEIVGVWMTADEGFEEKIEQKELQILLESQGKQFRLFADEKYLVDEYVPKSRTHSSNFDSIRNLTLIVMTYLLNP